MYTCEICGKTVNTSRSYLLDGKNVCRSCQLTASHIKKYGSLEAYRESKRLATEKTCQERYGTTNVSQVKEVQDKKVQTSLERYGTESPNQAQVVKDKKRGSSLEHYGTEYTLQAKEVRDKIKETSLSRYGVPCTLQSEESLEKIKNFNLRTHGTEHHNQSPIVKERNKLKFLEEYGVESIFQVPEVKAKIEATNLERYGVVNPLENKDIQDKCRNTLEERYGVSHSFEEGPIRDKASQTVKDRYGVNSYSQTQEYKDKYISTSLERYNVPNPMQSEEILNKVKSTNLERYGSECVFQSDYAKELIAKKRYEVRNSEEHILTRISKAEEAYELSYVRHFRRPSDNETVIIYKCKLCGDEVTFCQKDDPRHPYCHSCSSKGQSIQESEIKKFLTDLLPNDLLLMHNRSILHGKELDFYLPSHHLAIEFDGTYWHDGVDNSYKFEECKKSGIRLIRITEYDWWQRREKIQSLLKSALGIYDVKLGARKCTVKPISTEEYRTFMEDYHLQGYAPASVKLGLFYNDKLIQVEGYGTYRYSDKDSAPEWELIRECSLPGYQIFGGKSKIQAYFIENYNPTSILSYCHKDKFSGKSYEACGYKLIKETSPGYLYYRDGYEYSRIVFQKYKMESLVGTLLDSFDPELTEFENMDLNDYSRLYDYGNYVYLWEVNNV